MDPMESINSILSGLPPFGAGIVVGIIIASRVLKPYCESLKDRIAELEE